MKSLKSNYVLFFLLTFNSLYAQSNTAKWRSGFTASGCLNGMTAVPITNNNNAFSSSAIVGSRAWKFHYQAGFSTGFFLRKTLGDKFFIQGEANLLLNRQQAELDEQPPAIADLQFFFGAREGRKGTVKFNNLYLQIPIILGVSVNEETSLEAGFFISRSLVNKSESNLVTTTFSNRSNQTGQLVVFNPPIVTKTGVKSVAMPGGQGFSLGLQHNMTSKLGLRLRYEGSFASRRNEFRDVKENRLLVGIAYKLNQ